MFYVIDQVTCIFVLQIRKYVCVEKNDLYVVCAIDTNLYVFFKNQLKIDIYCTTQDTRKP